ncbi:MAG: AAA family ATPase [Saprospiraceae bacterium]|nr:AAA family ATPase [Saprospiraceae bacterium]
MWARSRIKKKLKNIFNELSGRFTVCYIEGVSGIGKSAFVAELYKDIVKEKGNYGIGKFDQFKRNIPYSALIQALNQVIQQILKESPEKVERWKHILKESLGNNSGLLFSVFPDLKLILGDVELVEIDDQALAKNRFVLAFKKFNQGFSQEDAPLVIFLDDLQWIDSETLLLFTDFLTQLIFQEKIILLSLVHIEIMK